MKLNDVDLFRLLPQFMRDDRNTQAFVYAITGQLKIIALSIAHARIYSRIDELSEVVLDELAWQFNVPEYNAEYSIDVKRDIVKRAMIIHRQRGTAGAVERVVKNIFGEASYLEEWFEYDGEPYHFKVHTSNPNITDEMLHEIERVIKETQNVRSWLEEVVIELMQKMSLYIGCKAIIVDDIHLNTKKTN